ncbi:alpha-tocopherol transfer protein-like [Ptychodera flava]|uniref:alpha-tocopherol transfer protein-like n=1 Tax=Ptychodera flava TaxID=63121 RepID=UPI003969F3ED
MADQFVYECKLSPDLQEKAKRELNETPETREECLKKLYETVRARPELVCPTDPIFLLGFLRARKFDLDRAIKLLENWCRVRTSISELYDDYGPAGIKDLLAAGLFTSLPSRDQDGRKVIILRLGKWDVKKFSIYDTFKPGLLANDLMLRDEETQINGITAIMDLGGMTMQHVTQFGPRVAMKVSPLVNDDCAPFRMKSFNIVNESGFFATMYAIGKPFMKEKMKQRMHVHGEDLTNLHKQITSSILPPEYGGSGPSIDDTSKEWVDYVMSKEKELLAMKEYGLKESKLGQKEVDDAATMEGTVGTFKKLDI